MTSVNDNESSVRVILCRVGCPPETMALKADANGSYLAQMQAIVDGYVEYIELDDGLELWCNDDRVGLHLNMIIPTIAPQPPEGFMQVVLDEGLASPGELGQWHIYGDCFIARSIDGELASVRDDDVERWVKRWCEAARVRMPGSEEQ